MLDRLYKLLSDATGILRIRDPRLELIAADRALEARYEVGLEASGTQADNIDHPFNQLYARVRPLHPTSRTAVYEIALWGYLWNDPIQAMANGWMGSDVHRHILEDATLTTWGLGLHREFKPGDSNPRDERWYAIGLFSYDLSPLTKRRVAFKAGPHSGVQFTANGQVLGEKDYTLVRDSGASYSVRHTFPGKGPHLFIVDGVWRNYWIPERPESQPVQL